MPYNFICFGKYMRQICKSSSYTDIFIAFKIFIAFCFNFVRYKWSWDTDREDVAFIFVFIASPNPFRGLYNLSSNLTILEYVYVSLKVRQLLQWQLFSVTPSPWRTLTILLGK